ncbi:two-component system, OmpR family, response regulator CpxR [Abditibacterium utsteinense]|uniref:Two-component system, OmpR family, response regulator CpxR n=1 Tax=Abditibacterium utsteinense TaxID=1960156 RepID=A0A2S8SQY5_9BACT|nr:response regulator transcription factor [Abditibacterium utsteinense]PQV63221.1 two-component system, OmpR family, response regulator CpxR [Abditibacterium utsteinense]
MLNRILLVEDDPELSELVAEYLSGEGWEIEVVHRGEEAISRIAGLEAFAAIVLDVMLPGLSGFEVLRRVRALETPAARTPIVMLTARGDEVDRVLGLEMGADDYLPKPFSSRELAARLRAILRRTAIGSATGDGADEALSTTEMPRTILRVGEFELDVAAHSARRGGVAIELTALELRLLELLMNHAGSVVTREQIAHEVLGRRLLLYDRSVDTHMSNLRRKLAPDDENSPVKTLRGTGYLFALPEQKS